jgi:hypothetical protein
VAIFAAKLVIGPFISGRGKCSLLCEGDVECGCRSDKEDALQTQHGKFAPIQGNIVSIRLWKVFGERVVKEMRRELAYFQGSASAFYWSIFQSDPIQSFDAGFSRKTAHSFPHPALSKVAESCQQICVIPMLIDQNP